jgi:hypothetical protein
MAESLARNMGNACHSFVFREPERICGAPKEEVVVIALGGRRIDPPDLALPVFPYTAVQRVRKRIRDLLKDSDATALVCSAACGADLIALEAAGELGIRRRIVLPFEPARFRETSVIDRPGDWGPAFDSVIKEVKAKHDLVNLNMDQDTEESYRQANQVILNEAISLAAASGDRVVAALAWNGISRSDNDITNAFGDSARSLGLKVLEVSTV